MILDGRGYELFAFGGFGGPRRAAVLRSGLQIGGLLKRHLYARHERQGTESAAPG